MGRRLLSGIRHRRIVGATVLSLTAMAAAGEAASAQAANFTCRASVLRLEAPQGNTVLEPVVSNNPNNPCTSDADGLPTIDLLGVSAKLLQSSTTNSATGSSAQASAADVALVRAGAPVVRAQVANSQASATCSAGAPAFSSSSQLAGLTINGQPTVVTGQPNQTINLLLATIVINQRITTADRVTRRALVVNVPGLLRLTVAESIADVSGNPCIPPPPPPKPQCSDGKDNDNDGKTDFDPRNDPPLHPFGDQQCTSPDDNNEAA